MEKNILIVDDDKVLRETLSFGLKDVGFCTITAQSAENALEILNRISVDAIVLDRMMDGMDGLSLLQQIRSIGNETPVIMLTALSGPENAIDGLSAGANDYLAKPFQLQELILRLNNIIKDKPQKQILVGLNFTDGEFFVTNKTTKQPELLALSSEEKKLLQNMITPLGNTVSATPMVAKRLRNKIKGVISDIDIITVRGVGYKIIQKKQ